MSDDAKPKVELRSTARLKILVGWGVQQKQPANHWEFVAFHSGTNMT
jgi:hypothetical protein